MHIDLGPSSRLCWHRWFDRKVLIPGVGTRIGCYGLARARATLVARGELWEDGPGTQPPPIVPLAFGTEAKSPPGRCSLRRARAVAHPFGSSTWVQVNESAWGHLDVGKLGTCSESRLRKFRCSGTPCPSCSVGFHRIFRAIAWPSLPLYFLTPLRSHHCPSRHKRSSPAVARPAGVTDAATHPL